MQGGRSGAAMWSRAQPAVRERIVPLPMDEKKRRAILDKVRKEVDSWPESKKMALRVGKYADAKEEAKAVRAAYRHPDCGCRLK